MPSPKFSLIGFPMRFLIAAASFILSILLLLTGFAQRTIWAPPANISTSVSITPTGSYVVIPHSVISQHPGNPTVRLEQAGPLFAASGRESDVMAWVGKSQYDSISKDKKSGELVTFSHPGSGIDVSPVGSDLWRTENSASDSLDLKVVQAEEAAVLVATTGRADAPRQVELVWPIFHDLTWSNVLLISGLVIFVAAIIFVIVSAMVLRRRRGPKRRIPKAPKPPQYRQRKRAKMAPAKGRRSTRRAMIAAPAAILVLAMLSACTPAAPSASPKPSSAIDAPPVSVNFEQIKRILTQVEAAAEAGDEGSDKKVLTSRFAGPALNIRTIHYFLRKKSASIPALPAIVAKPLTFSLPAASDSWPRTIMAVTDEIGDSALPQMLVLQQANPRANYKLWYNVRLMPGAKIPAVPAAEIGAIPVDSNSVFLKIAPKSVPAAYGDMLNNGASSLSAGLFDTTEDEFYTQVSQSQKDQTATLTTGKITFQHTLGDKNVMSLATSAGGALVAVYMTDIYTIKPVRVGSAVAVAGSEKLLLGADGSTKGVRSIYGDMLLFYVPALTDSDAIRLLGVTQGLISVRSL
ncbi:MAG: hypothetical protein RLZZ229_546 [Actinomycetota bacterium]